MSLAEQAASALKAPAVPQQPVESPRQVALREAWEAMQAQDQQAFSEAFNNAIDIALAERE